MLSGLAKTVFRLNGQFLALGEELARPVGLTAAWWQVLATVLNRGRPVADIAREVGVTRQGVQRVADLLVEHGLAEYQPNPVHRRAKLLQPTDQGRAAVRRIAPSHAAVATRLANKLGDDELRRIFDDLTQLSEVLDVLRLPTRNDAVGMTESASPGSSPARAASGTRKKTSVPGVGSTTAARA
jgi:DNA-binding MarR family transcriptional regulator